jgi:hypothetical protein
MLALLLVRSLQRKGEFDLAEISVWGCREIDSTAVAGCLGAYLGRPLFEITPGEMEEALRSTPGIVSADVWFEIPDRACASIVLEDPVIAVRDAGTETAMTRACEPLPATFLSDTLTRIVINGGRSDLVLDELAGWAASREIPEDVESILVEPVGAVAVTGDGMRIVLGYGDLCRRFQVFRSVEGRSVVREGWVEADMRFDGQIVLRGVPTDPGGAAI